MPSCLRCGREISTEQYCDTCNFYVFNDQCWRCRMYLPKVELQQWRGQTYCPYCIMDIRDEEKGAEERRGERERQAAEGIPPEEKGFGPGQKNPDYLCDKCKDDLDIVYVVADHKFCELCFEQQRKTWKKENIPTPPFIKFRAKESPGLIVQLIKFLKRKIREEWEKRNKKKDK